MVIYVAASWKHEHAVILLTRVLRAAGYEVRSFVENNHGEQRGHAALNEDGTPIPFEEWVHSDRGVASFAFDTQWVAHADCVIYIGPSGTDAWAEVGLAYGNRVPVLGLWAKGEQIGLMRHMVAWCSGIDELLGAVKTVLGK